MPSKKSDCPLFLHANKQWAKKVRGQFFYFGRDKDEALAKWLDEKDYILAGRKPPRTSKDPKLDELVNLYLEFREREAGEGEILDRTFHGDVATLKRLVKFMGAKSCPGNWGPTDFMEIKSELAKPIIRTTPLRGKIIIWNKVEKRSPNTVAGDIRRIKAFLNYCRDAGHIGPPKYGREFSQPSEKAKRRNASATGRRDIQPQDFLKIVEAATREYKPFLWLGINCGLGNSDIAAIRTDQVGDLDREIVWLDLPRGKTGVERRTPLWPETVQAIRDCQARRAPAKRGYGDLLLLTRYGFSWVRDISSSQHNAVSASFRRFSRRVGVMDHQFYDLRRTFLTIGEETLDFPAVQHLMGHKPRSGDMSAIYRQHISDERLLAVSNHVRNWLLGAK